jgi:hypothetical protein
MSCVKRRKSFCGCEMFVSFVDAIFNRQSMCCSGHPGSPDFEIAVDKALKAGVVEPKRALPLVTESIEQLKGMSVRELKQLLVERGVSLAGLSEKQDLVNAIDKDCRTITHYS